MHPRIDMVLLEEFQVLVNALKEEGIGVIIDWVPPIFPVMNLHSGDLMELVYLSMKIQGREKNMRSGIH